MPRQLDAGELFRKLTDVSLYVPQTTTPGSTTTTAAITGSGSEATVAVTAITNFTSGDPVLIRGSGGVELGIIGTPNTTMPMTPPPLVAQDSGAVFVEAVRKQLGKITENGIGITLGKPLTEILSAIDDGPIAFLDGNLSVQFTVGLYGWNAANWQNIANYKEAETGAGTAASPYQGIIGAVNQALIDMAVVRLTGVRHDGKLTYADLLDCRFEPSGEVAHSRSAPAVLTLAGRATKLKVGYWS